MSQEIDRIIRRTQYYYYEDGLVETAVGILFTIIGLALLGWLTLPINPALGIVMVFVSIGLIFGSTLFVQKVIPMLKERITHPRTGTVNYEHNKPTRGRWLVTGAALIVAVFALVFPDYLSKMSVVEGLLLGIILCYLGYRVRLYRFYLLGGAALAIGIVAAMLFDNDITGSAFTFGVTGLIMVVSGLIVLTTYLRRHPIAEVDNE
jgi:hypothetical protein